MQVGTSQERRKGLKVHIVVNTLEHLLTLKVTTADASNRMQPTSGTIKSVYVD